MGSNCLWRLESRYRYSGSLVYNNYPWPENITARQRSVVEVAAQGIFDARAEFPSDSLADLYDSLTMPAALVRAHAALDRAVESCYRKQPFQSDLQRVEHLFAMYERLSTPLVSRSKAKGNRPISVN